jgi:hypothetical protein
MTHDPGRPRGTDGGAGGEAEDGRASAARSGAWVGDASGGAWESGPADEIPGTSDAIGPSTTEPAQVSEPGDEPEPGDREPEPDDEPGPGVDETPTYDEAPEPTPARAELAPGGRALPLRLARLHLRMGSLALARAELESFAGGGSLDEPALLDLAEARWRTGDLAGAGEAANAALERGVDDPLALVIAAEAVAGLGRPAEARRLAGRALESTGLTLDVLFAGMPRSTVWPSDEAREETADAEGAGAALLVRGRQPEASVPASAAAAEAFAGGRGALARGDVAGAALRLGVAIRLEPGFAQAVLAAIGDRASSEPVLALVAGDALRLLGREHEALAAFDVARGKPQVAGAQPSAAEPESAPEPEPSWPET